MRAGLLAGLAFAFTATVAAAQEQPPLQRIAFSSCNRDYKPQTLWKPILETQPDVWIWLGDIVYGRADDPRDLARRYASLKNNPDYTALRERARVLGVWDDNDFGVSNGGSANKNKAESQRLLLDFLDEPAESPRRQQRGVYASYGFGPPGKQVKVILLDCRYFRDKPGANADILGEEQWRWLEQQLSGSSADVHVIGSGIQVIAHEHRYEKWANFPRARERLLELIAKSRPRNTVIVSGDRHLGEISRLADARLQQPLYDITASGMTHHAQDGLFVKFSSEQNRHRVGSNCADLNFGLIEFDWSASPPTATFQIRGGDNTVHAAETMELLVPHPREP
jgi:alkaline phosphatase D